LELGLMIIGAAALGYTVAFFYFNNDITKLQNALKETENRSFKDGAQDYTVLLNKLTISEQEKESEIRGKNKALAEIKKLNVKIAELNKTINHKHSTIQRLMKKKRH